MQQVQPWFVVRRLRREVHGAERYRCGQARLGERLGHLVRVEDRVEPLDHLPVGADEHEARLEGEPELVDHRRLGVGLLVRVGVHLGVEEADVGVVAGDAEEHVEHRPADRDLAERRRRHEQRERPVVLQRVGHA